MRNRDFLGRVLADWPAKVLSLCAALLLFFFYQLNRLENRPLSVPLEVKVGADFVPASQYPRSVRVTLRGESGAIYTIQEEDIVARLDLSSYRSEGSFRVPIQIERAGTALGVDPLEIQVEPADVELSIERRSARAVPVSPAFRGFVQKGFEIAGFEIQPPDVEISGPASAVDKVVDVKTEPIELTGRASDFTVKAKLVRKESLVALSGTGSVDVRVSVARSAGILSFEDVEIAVGGLPDGLVPVPPLPRARVDLRPIPGAEAPALADLPFGTLWVDASGLRASGAYELAVAASAPGGYEIVGLEPSEARLEIAEGTAEAVKP